MEWEDNKNGGGQTGQGCICRPLILGIKVETEYAEKEEKKKKEGRI